jgi:hypothetical protein
MSRFKKGFQKLGFRTSDFFKRKTFSRSKSLLQERKNLLKKQEPMAQKPEK